LSEIQGTTENLPQNGTDYLPQNRTSLFRKAPERKERVVGERHATQFVEKIGREGLAISKKNGERKRASVQRRRKKRPR